MMPLTFEINTLIMIFNYLKFWIFYPALAGLFIGIGHFVAYYTS